MLGEFDYRVTNVAREEHVLHVSLVPRRDPNRNRLRDLYVDAKTLELQEVVATDKLYEDGHVYPMMFTVTLGWLHDMPVVTHIHGAATYETDAEYLGKGAIVGLRFHRPHVPGDASRLVFRTALLRRPHRRRAELAAGRFSRWGG